MSPPWSTPRTTRSVSVSLEGGRTLENSWQQQIGFVRIDTELTQHDAVPQEQIGYRLHPAIPKTYLQNLWRMAKQDTPLKKVAVPRCDDKIVGGRILPDRNIRGLLRAQLNNMPTPRKRLFQHRQQPSG